MITIQVDGSWSSNNPTKSGWGFFVEEINYSESGVVEGQYALNHRQVVGELKATMAALKWAKDNGHKEVIIRFDYMGVREWATGAWKANKPVTRLYRDWMSSMLKIIKVVFVHRGNERAHDLACQAREVK